MSTAYRTDDADETDVLPPGARVGDYRIERLVERRRESLVYCAQDLRSSEPVSLEEFYPRDAVLRASDLTVSTKTASGRAVYAADMAAFRAGAQALIGVHHPRIAGVRAVFEANGTIYVARDAVDGEGFEQRLSAGPLPAEAIATLIAGVLDLLAFLRDRDGPYRSVASTDLVLRDDGSPVLVRLPTPNAAAQRDTNPPLAGPGALLYRAATGRAWQAGGGSAPSTDAANGRYDSRLLDIIDRLLLRSDADGADALSEMRAAIAALQPPRPARPSPDRRVAEPQPAAAAAARRSAHGGRLGLVAAVAALPVLLATGAAWFLIGGHSADRPAAPMQSDATPQSVPAPPTIPLAGLPALSSQPAATPTLSATRAEPVAPVHQTAVPAAEPVQSAPESPARRPEPAAPATALQLEAPPPVADANSSRLASGPPPVPPALPASPPGAPPRSPEALPSAPAAVSPPRFPTATSPEPAASAPSSAAPAVALSAPISPTPPVRLPASLPRTAEAPPSAQAAVPPPRVATATLPEHTVPAPPPAAPVAPPQPALTASAPVGEIAPVAAASPPSSAVPASLSTPAPQSHVALSAPLVPLAGRALAARPSPGTTFQDCPTCPVMTVLPSGMFPMGSADGPASERPVHRVTIASRFAIGQSAVTFAEWDACVTAGGCTFRPSDHGWGRGDRPAIGLSYTDAQAYADWLAKTTGERYRLPSEAEWEYADRGGTTTAYWWGDEARMGLADCADCEAEARRMTVPTRSYPPNPFGLYDTAGNVAEWVADCWTPDYANAPGDGSAVTTGSCAQHVLRGGNFASDLRALRSAARFKYDTNVRYYTNGIRVARDIR